VLSKKIPTTLSVFVSSCYCLRVSAKIIEGRRYLDLVAGLKGVGIGRDGYLEVV
jgi:hypothetical protein